MPFEVLDTDKFFYDSPDSGDPDCLCSRCGNKISEEEAPILRAWPSGHGDHGWDPNTSGGTEFRYCWACSKQMGIDFGERSGRSIDYMDY